MVTSNFNWRGRYCRRGHLRQPLRPHLEILENRLSPVIYSLGFAADGITCYDDVGFTMNAVAFMDAHKDHVQDTNPDDFQAQINWDTSQGNNWEDAFLAPTAPSDAYPFQIKGSHVYHDPGTYSVAVRVTDPNGDATTRTFLDNVRVDPMPGGYTGMPPPAIAASLSPSYVEMDYQPGYWYVPQAQTGAEYSSPPLVAGLHGRLQDEVDTNQGDFHTWINWGDGPDWSEGQITLNANNFFDVRGTHTYEAAGTYPIVVYAVGPDGTSHSEKTAEARVIAVPDIVATGLDWHTETGTQVLSPSRDGGIDLSYEVRYHTLSGPATLGLYWTQGDTYDPSAPLVSRKLSAITVGTHSLHVPAGALGLPPDGRSRMNTWNNDLHLVLVINADHNVQESNDDNNVIALSATPTDILSPVFSTTTGAAILPVEYQTNGAEITATFRPAGGALTIAQAAAICGVSHFNWVQEVVDYPEDWTVYNADTGWIESPMNGDQIPLPDPVSYQRIIRSPAALPVSIVAAGDGSGFVWNEVVNPNARFNNWYNRQLNPDPFSFRFQDSPMFPVRTLNHQALMFRTYLTGVTDAHTQQRLPGSNLGFTWWADTVSLDGIAPAFGGAFGIGYFDTLLNHLEPPVGSGGVFDVRADEIALTGPSGFGPGGYITAGTLLPYQIAFTNPATATSPVQQVVITQQLDSALDWATFQLTDLAFGSVDILVPPGQPNYQTSVSMTYDGVTFDVHLTVALNPTTGLLTITFQSLDHDTGLPPVSQVGFLPPEDGTGRGMGKVRYTILPRTDAVTGTQLHAVATVVYDANSPISTDLYVDSDPSLGNDPSARAPNTIDAGIPTSQVTALPANGATDITVSWSGQDMGEAGIAHYSIYVSVDHGPWVAWLTDTTLTSVTYIGQPKHSYAFYSLATDNAGNVELKTPTAEAQTSTPALLYTLTETENIRIPEVISVAALIGGSYGDLDANSRSGIAVTALTGNGTWQYSSSGRTWLTMSNLSESHALLLPASYRIRFSPASNWHGSADLVYRAWDGSTGASGAYVAITAVGGATSFSVNTGQVTVTVTDVNHAPTWTGSNVALSPVLPNATDPAGDTVFQAFGDLFADLDGEPTGVAVVGQAGTTGGTWQYALFDPSIQNHGPWTDLPVVSSVSALLLSAEDQIRFVPDAGSLGMGKLQIRAWDGTQGSNGGMVNLSSSGTTGGATPFSPTVLNASLIVNTAPTLVGTVSAMPAANENVTSQPRTVATLLSDALHADLDPGASSGVAITAAAGPGVWQYLLPGSSWKPMPAVSPYSVFLLPATAQVRFVPTHYQNGLAGIAYRAWDRTEGGAGSLFSLDEVGGAKTLSSTLAVTSIDINPVNQAPTWTAATTTLTGTGNPQGRFVLPPDAANPAGVTVAAAFSRCFKDLDGDPTGVAIVGLTGMAGGAWEYSVDGGAWSPVNTASIASALLLSDSDKIRFLPNPGFVGLVSIKARAWDGSTGPSGARVNLLGTGKVGGTTAFSTATLTANGSVNSVNDAPTWTAKTASLTTVLTSDSNPAGQSVQQVFGGSFNDLETAPVGVAVVGLTGTGTWQYFLAGGSEWQNLAGVSTARARLLAANDLIRYVPDPGQAGTVSLLARAWDGYTGADGEIANLTLTGTGGLTAFSSTVLTARCLVNSAPTFVSATGPILSTTREGVASTPVTVASLLSTVGVLDADPRALKGIAVVGTSGIGTWQYLWGGGGWKSMGAVAELSPRLLPSTAYVRFLPAVYQSSGEARLTFRAWDQTEGTAGGLSTISSTGGSSAFSPTEVTAVVGVTSINHAPVLSTGSTFQLTPELPGTTNTINDTVMSILGNALNDGDASPVRGIAIVGLSGAYGTWQYSRDDGQNWQDVGTVSASSALLLRDSDLLRYVPKPGFVGLVKLSFKAWDQTSGDLGTKANTSTGTSFSKELGVVTILINTAPVLSG